MDVISLKEFILEENECISIKNRTINNGIINSFCFENLDSNPIYYKSLEIENCIFENIKFQNIIEKSISVNIKNCQFINCEFDNIKMIYFLLELYKNTYKNCIFKNIYFRYTDDIGSVYHETFEKCLFDKIYNFCQITYCAIEINQCKVKNVFCTGELEEIKFLNSEFYKFSLFGYIHDNIFNNIELNEFTIKGGESIYENEFINCDKEKVKFELL